MTRLGLVLIAVALSGCGDGTGARPVIRAPLEQVVVFPGSRLLAVPYSEGTPPNVLSVDSGSAVVDLRSGHFTMRIMGKDGGPYMYADTGNVGSGFPSVTGDTVIYNRPSSGLVGEVRIVGKATVIMYIVGAALIPEAVFGP